MNYRYEGPEFMKAHFYPCPPELKDVLPEHNVRQGLQCLNGQKELQIDIREGIPVVFSHCETCEISFKVSAQEDYPSGYIQDDHEKPLKRFICECGGQSFQIALGYEYPGDEIDSTDISWFTMVGKCSTCGLIQELFSDETA